MIEPGAELAYLFRHALLRDAAYELQPPRDRGRLHALALDVIEQLFEGREAELDVMASELVRHAELAGRDDRECHWLEFAAWQLGERAVALKQAGDPGAPEAYEAALTALRAHAPADVKYYEDKWSAAPVNDCVQ